MSSILSEVRETRTLLRHEREVWKTYRSEQAEERSVLQKISEYTLGEVIGLVATVSVLSLMGLPPLFAYLAVTGSWAWGWLLTAFFVLIIKPGTLRFGGLASDFELLRMPTRRGFIAIRWLGKLRWALGMGISWSIVAAIKIAYFTTLGVVDSFLFIVAVAVTPVLVLTDTFYDELYARAEPLRPSVRRLVVASRVVGFLWGLTLLGFCAALPGLLDLEFYEIVVRLGGFFLVIVLLITGVMIRVAIELAETCESFRRSPREESENTPASTNEVLSTFTLPSPSAPHGLFGGRLLLWWWSLRDSLRFPGLRGSIDWISVLVLSVALLLRGPLLAAIAVVATNWDLPPLLMPLAAGFFAARVFVTGGPDSDDAEHLYLLGVDFRDQILFNLKSLFFCAMLPTMMVGTVTLACTSGTWAGLAALAGIAATFLLRAGYRGLPGISETSLKHLFLVPTLLCASVLFRGSPTAVFVVAAVMAAVGILGLANRLRRLDEASIRDLMTDEDL